MDFTVFIRGNNIKKKGKKNSMWREGRQTGRRFSNNYHCLENNRDKWIAALTRGAHEADGTVCVL